MIFHWPDPTAFSLFLLDQGPSPMYCSLAVPGGSSPPFRHPGWQADTGSNVRHAPPRRDSQKKNPAPPPPCSSPCPHWGCQATGKRHLWLGFFWNESLWFFYPEGLDRIIIFYENYGTAEPSWKRIGWQIQIQPIMSPIIEQKGHMPKFPSFWVWSWGTAVKGDHSQKMSRRPKIPEILMPHVTTVCQESKSHSLST